MNDNGKKVLVIGGGIAGLTAGIYAKRSGFDVTILEQHTIPGGMCTGWRRKGYLFDGAMHWLTGSSANMPALNTIWREVGALSDEVPVRYEEVFESLSWEGKVIYVYRDMERTRRHFKEISPEDASAIDRFVDDVLGMTKMQMPVMNIRGLKTATKTKGSTLGMLKMLPVFPLLARLSKITASEYAAHFRHPGLRLLLNSMVADASWEYSALPLIISLATIAAGDGGRPEGGSLAMTKRMADTFTALGGNILYGTRAEKVLVKDGSSIGAKVNGKEMLADAVIITQEVLAAVEQLFEKSPQDEWIMKLKKEVKPAVCCFVSIGVGCELKETSMFAPEKPIQFGEFSFDMLPLNNYFDYPGYAPEGKTALTTGLFGDSYDFWKKARSEGRYEEEKQAIADQIVSAICAQYPQCEGKIEVIDIATPLTYERYTGSSHGSWMTVMEKGESSSFSSPCTLDGVNGLYFAGHRVMRPGGMPAALMSGRTAAQMVCRQFDVVFV